MRRIAKTLTKMGLNGKEAHIYLNCLQHGVSTASTLAKNTGIPRTSVYDYAERLVQKGFLKMNKQGSIVSYIATSPEDLTLLMKRKGNELLQQADAIAELADEFLMAQQNNGYEPKVKYMEGKDAIRLLYQKLQTHYSWSMFNLDVSVAEGTIADVDHLLYILKDPAISAKKLLMDSPMARAFRDRIGNVNPNIEVKCLPAGMHIDSDHIMFNGIFSHVSYGNILSVIEITDPVFYDTQRKMFDMLRER